MATDPVLYARACTYAELGRSARLTIEVFRDLGEACSSVEVSGKYEPKPEQAEIYEDAYLLYRDLYPALMPLMHRTSALAELSSAEDVHRPGGDQGHGEQ